MNRSIKLLAYTFFALALPIWIYFGKKAEEATKPFAVSIDKDNLKKIDSIVMRFDQPESTANNAALNNALSGLGESNKATNESINRLTNVIADYVQGQRNNVDREVTVNLPSEVTVSLKNDSGKPEGNNGPSSNSLNKDSIAGRLSDLREQAAALVSNLSPDTILLDIINVDPKEKSINRELSLGSSCCGIEKQRILSMVAELDSIAGALQRNPPGVSKGNNTDSLLIENIKKDTADLANHLKTIEDKCARVLVFGIRNVSGTPFNISLADNNSKSKFVFAGKNQILSTTETKDSSVMANNNDVAYFQINNPCIGKQATGFYNFKLDFKRERNIIGNRPDIGYLNLRLRK